MTKQARTKRLLWLLVPAALGAGTLYGVLARSGDAETGKSSHESRKLAAVPQNQSLMAKAAELTRHRGMEAGSRTAAAYGEWASDPSALNARKVLLASLFAEDDVATKLHGVLAAIEADPTPPANDPLWQQTATQLADLWTGDIATKGMDLALAEKRPRAHRVLISSLVVVATSERVKGFTPDQRQTLTETMIDVSSRSTPEEKKELAPALRALGGNDLADIMAGKGLTGKDGHVLESERAYNAALDQAKDDADAQGQAAAP